jgi:hypothetical protein
MVSELYPAVLPRKDRLVEFQDFKRHVRVRLRRRIAGETGLGEVGNLAVVGGSAELFS